MASILQYCDASRGDSCYLCREDLTGKERKKRKRLNSNSASVFRSVLVDFVENSDVSIDLADPDAYLCHTCVSQLVNYSTAKEKLTLVTNLLLAKLQSLQTSRRKRPSSNILIPSAKDARIEEPSCSRTVIDPQIIVS